MIEKSFNTLPDYINYNFKVYERDETLTKLHEQKKPFDNKGLILAKVLERHLKGVLDENGNPYKPKEYIYKPK